MVSFLCWEDCGWFDEFSHKVKIKHEFPSYMNFIYKCGRYKIKYWKRLYEFLYNETIHFFLEFFDFFSRGFVILVV